MNTIVCGGKIPNIDAVKDLLPPDDDPTREITIGLCNRDTKQMLRCKVPGGIGAVKDVLDLFDQCIIKNKQQHVVEKPER